MMSAAAASPAEAITATAASKFRLIIILFSRSEIPAANGALVRSSEVRSALALSHGQKT